MWKDDERVMMSDGSDGGDGAGDEEEAPLGSLSELLWVTLSGNWNREEG